VGGVVVKGRDQGADIGTHRVHGPVGQIAQEFHGPFVIGACQGIVHRALAKRLAGGVKGADHMAAEGVAVELSPSDVLSRDPGRRPSLHVAAVRDLQEPGEVGVGPDDHFSARSSAVRLSCADRPSRLPTLSPIPGRSDEDPFTLRPTFSRGLPFTKVQRKIQKGIRQIKQKGQPTLGQAYLKISPFYWLSIISRTYANDRLFQPPKISVTLAK